IATDLVDEKLVSPKEALLLVDPESLNQLLAPGFDQDEWKKIPAATRGLPASPGAASGQVVFTADHAVEWTQQGSRSFSSGEKRCPTTSTACSSRRASSPPPAA